jgi:ElaB/YqjD/DUF883 family membrane-anchored ribosome-binding protein
MTRSILVLALLVLPAAAQKPTAADYKAANRILAGKSQAEINRLDYELERVLDDRAKQAINGLAEAIDAERALRRTGRASNEELQEAMSRVAAADAILQEAFNQCQNQFLAPKRLRVAAYVQWRKRQGAK